MYHANLIGGIVARLSGIRTISWGIHHTNLVPEVSPWSTILVARISALLSHLVPASIVCCSQRSIEVHRGIGYRADKLIYIPNGYDISRFKPDSWERNRIRLELGIQGPIPLLGMVARHDPQKDHDNLIKALGILKRSRVVFRCALIGTGMDGTNQSLREAIDREGLFEDIILLGRRDDIPRIMNGLDLHILSSSSESFPNVLAEAMACGTPCVTTNVGDAAIIIGETGWLVPPSDPAALAGAIEMAIKERSQDPSGWQKRCAAARDRIASNFEIGLMVAMYRDCWRAISGRVIK
jgi:glycosyltransferase involved in cell wall biosynthesis